MGSRGIVCVLGKLTDGSVPGCDHFGSGGD